MQRESQKDRTILCKYEPTEPGDYRIEVKWSGENVPGSPFMVMIFDTQEELSRFLQVRTYGVYLHFQDGYSRRRAGCHVIRVSSNRTISFFVFFREAIRLTVGLRVNCTAVLAEAEAAAPTLLPWATGEVAILSTSKASPWHRGEGARGTYEWT